MNKSINESNLNASQFERLKTLYVETFVNSMSHEDLLIYVINDMEDFCKEDRKSVVLRSLEARAFGVQLAPYIRPAPRPPG